MNTNTTTETVTQPREIVSTKETVSTTFVLPVEIWRALRNSSTDRMVSQQQIVAEALRSYLGLNQSAAA